MTTTTETTKVADSMDDILHPGADAEDPDFPHAPDNWSSADAVSVAAQEGLELEDDHWEVVRALQEFYARHRDSGIHARELHDALDEKFHARGGMKYLYRILPRGPVNQGCKLAGLDAPPGAVDTGFGSVQ